MTPDKVLAAIRNSDKNYATTYDNGGCFQTYILLRYLYPQAICWYDGNHIYTQIDDKYYDIHGSYRAIPKISIRLDKEPEHFKNAFRWKK